MKKILFVTLFTTLCFVVVPGLTHAQNAKASFTAGVVELTSGSYKKAVTHFSEAIRLKKDYTDAYFNRAIAYEGLGEQKKALKDYSTVIEQNPKMAEAYINRGLIYQNQEELAKALKDFSSAIRFDPGNGFAYLHRARVYKADGEMEKAKEDYLVAADQLPNLKVVHTDLIVIYRSEGNYAACIGHYDKLIELEPSVAEHYEGRGEAYENTDQTEAACKDYRKAKELGMQYLNEKIMHLCSS